MTSAHKHNSETANGRANDYDERAPLLSSSDSDSNDDVPTPSAAELAADRRFQIKVSALCIGFLVVLEFSTFIMEAPIQQITEDVICFSTYPDHVIGQHDDRCKNNDVQKSLTHYKSIITACSMLFPLIVQIPFGIVADHYGRRPVLFLAISVLAIYTTFGVAVLALPHIFSIWWTVPTTAIFLFGGGGQTISAMVWTMLSDVVPVANRASVFYQLSAIMLIFSAVLFPLSAWLMRISPWLPVLLGVAFLWTAVFMVLFMPETKNYQSVASKFQAMQEPDTDSDEWQPESTAPSKEDFGVFRKVLRAVKTDAHRVWKFVFGSPGIMLLVLAESVITPLGLVAVTYGLQYATSRFNWDWSHATFIQTIPRVTGIVTLMVGLPILAKIVNDRGVNPLKRDLNFARLSILAMGLGNFFIFAADTQWVFIMGTISMSLGIGYTSQIRALITAVVEPHLLATVNTTLSTVETLLSLLSMPIIGWLFATGIDMGGAWRGLPYLVLSSLCLGVAALLVLYRIPPVKESHLA